MESYAVSAEDAKKMLIEGNQEYVASRTASVDASEEILATSANGQKPYAIVVTCADSRVIPEAIFSAGIGDIFVIRVAGNVIGENQLGSIEYAAGHLGSRLVVVLGHSSCGAVDAAINHQPEGYVKSITDVIKKAIGSEKDPAKACCLNVQNSCKTIEEAISIPGLEVAGAVYHLDSGEVEFL